MDFLVVYTYEPHANEGIYGGIDQPRQYCERLYLAGLARREMSLGRMLLVDTMDDRVQTAYGGCPNMLYIIDPAGKVAYHNLWSDVAETAKALAELLGRPE